MQVGPLVRGRGRGKNFSAFLVDLRLLSMELHATPGAFLAAAYALSSPKTRKMQGSQGAMHEAVFLSSIEISANVQI
jgi:hypothetical protein